MAILALYTFAKGDGTDSSGNGRDLVVTGSPTFATFNGKKAVTGFSGSNILNLPTSLVNLLNNSAVGSISMYVYCTAGSMPGNPPYYGLTGANGVSQWLFGNNAGGGGQSTETYSALANGGNLSSSGAGLSVGVWINLAFEWNSGGSNKIFINGVQKATEGGGTFLGVTGHAMGLGCNDGAGSNNLVGYITQAVFTNDSNGIYPYPGSAPVTAKNQVIMF